MPYFTYWFLLACAVGVAADAKLETDKWKARYLRKHLMFKLATEDFNRALSLLTQEERERVVAVFKANDEFLEVVMGDISN